MIKWSGRTRLLKGRSSWTTHTGGVGLMTNMCRADPMIQTNRAGQTTQTDRAGLTTKTGKASSKTKTGRTDPHELGRPNDLEVLDGPDKSNVSGRPNDLYGPAQRPVRAWPTQQPRWIRSAHWTDKSDRLDDLDRPDPAQPI